MWLYCVTPAEFPTTHLSKCIGLPIISCMYRVGNPMYVRYNIYNICATYAGAADASDATKAAQPDKYLNQDGAQKTKWNVAGVTCASVARPNMISVEAHACIESVKAHYV
eukprot:COSAG05_NODE_2662_length_2791_cov_4.086181_2_plen_110_part_00